MVVLACSGGDDEGGSVTPPAAAGDAAAPATLGPRSPEPAASEAPALEPSGPVPPPAPEPETPEPGLEPEPAATAPVPPPTDAVSEPSSPVPVASDPAGPDPGPDPFSDAGSPQAPGTAGSASGPDGGSPLPPLPDGLLWPIDCVPEDTCFAIGFPDIDGDGVRYDCGAPGYVGHEGTDIPITWDQMDAGVDVYAAAAGEVLFVFDGKYDRCPDDSQPDCAEPPGFSPENADGVQVCTPLGPYCGTGEGSCYWCFWGGNVVVIRHPEVEGVFATRYDHLRRGSIVVQPGEIVVAGQKIAEVGSAGNSTGPHLHFELWTTGFYELEEPWVGECGPNTTTRYWASNPPWL